MNYDKLNTILSIYLVPAIPQLQHKTVGIRQEVEQIREKTLSLLRITFLLNVSFLKVFLLIFSTFLRF